MNSQVVFFHRTLLGLGRLNRTHPLPLWPALWLTQACCVMLKIMWVKDHNVSLKLNKQAVEAEYFCLEEFHDSRHLKISYLDQKLCWLYSLRGSCHCCRFVFLIVLKKHIQEGWFEVSDLGRSSSKSSTLSTNGPTVPDLRKSSVEAKSSVKAKFFSTTQIQRSVLSVHPVLVAVGLKGKKSLFGENGDACIHSEQPENCCCCLVFISHLSLMFMKKRWGRREKKC